MAKVYAQLDDRLTKFILAQPIFFVATAPRLSAEGEGGHVNVSPKGYRDTFAIIGPRTVAYLDLTGSGAETIAHLRQNGRITIMFCSFDRSPKILRLYGTGRVVLPPEQGWPRLAAYFGGADHAARAWAANGHGTDARPANGHGTDGYDADGYDADGYDADGQGADGQGADGQGAGQGPARLASNGADRGNRRAEHDTEHYAERGADRGTRRAEHDTEHYAERGADRGTRRAIIVAELDRIADSCGYAVPVMELAGERDLLSRWSEKRTPEQLAAYRAELNAVSIDGLPALS
jgi:Pyridoxamine 5'-phosphate oxidase